MLPEFAVTSFFLMNNRDAQGDFTCVQFVAEGCFVIRLRQNRQQYN